MGRRNELDYNDLELRSLWEISNVSYCNRNLWTFVTAAVEASPTSLITSSFLSQGCLDRSPGAKGLENGLDSSLMHE